MPKNERNYPPPTVEGLKYAQQLLAWSAELETRRVTFEQFVEEQDE